MEKVVLPFMLPPISSPYSLTQMIITTIIIINTIFWGWGGDVEIICTLFFTYTSLALDNFVKVMIVCRQFSVGNDFRFINVVKKCRGNRNLDNW